MGLWQWIKGEEPGLIETIRNYENAGQWGEYLTEYLLNEHNLPGKLKVFTNLYIPNQDKESYAKTTEIDVMMIHETGIYVFESKNYSGWIYGDADKRQWTQTLKNGWKNKFYNPILQNRSHIQALSEYLSLPREHFHSYIVFSERCELKRVPESCTDYVIVRRPRLLKALRRDICSRELLYPERAFSMIDQMLSIITTSEIEKRDHIERVKGFTEGMICPWCGEELVERTGKNGRFLGCSGFPKCRFTRKI